MTRPEAVALACPAKRGVGTLRTDTSMAVAFLLINRCSGFTSCSYSAERYSYSIAPDRFCCSIEYEYEYRLTPEYEYEIAGTAEPGEFSPAELVVYDRY